MSKTIFKNLPFEKLKLNGEEVSTQTVNQEELDIHIDEFLNNDIVLIRSGTGTSKTKLIARLAPQLIGKDDKLLSIVNLISLSREQISTFGKESSTNLFNYQTSTEQFNTNNGVICLNSLTKLQNNKEIYDLKNKVVFIDEINDIISSLTHNDSMDPILNLTYNYLITIIKNCKKLILTDATINQNTINLIASRTTNNKITLINNIYKKFDNIPAIHYKNKFEFIDELRSCIKNKKYFLFGCDIRIEVSSIYSNLVAEFPEQKNDFILITSETDIKINDPNEQFKLHYVFYSPSITTGISYANREEKQTHFIYMSNKRLITPESFYQMSCRTRNMEKLIYHCEEMNDIECEFETLKELENKYKNLMKTNEKILCLSKSTTIDDDVKIVENSFFKMWCYEEYKRMLFKTGFLQHYKNILSNAGFIHSDKGEYVKMSRKEKMSLKEIYDKYTDKQFNNFLEFKYIDDTENRLKTKPESKEYKEFMTRKNTIDEMDEDTYLKYIKDESIKYSILEKRHDILGLTSRDETETNKIFLHDEYALRNFFNVLTLFKTKEHIKKKLESKRDDGYLIKTLDSVYNKLSLIQKFEKHYNITRFDFNFDNVDIDKEFSDNKQKLYTELFDTKKTNFKNKHDLQLIYINMIRSIAGGKGGIPIIDRKEAKITIDGVRKKTYKNTPNVEMFKHIITIAKYKNPSLKHYDLEFVKTITGIEPLQTNPDEDIFKDEENEYISYLFNKQNFKTIE